MPIGWMWKLRRMLTALSDLRMRATNQHRSSDYTLRRVNIGRCGLFCLSNIAHMQRFDCGPVLRPDRSCGASGWSNGVQGRKGRVRNVRSKGVHLRPRILKFLSTVKADLIRPLLDGEHAAELTVLAAKNQSENPKQDFHA
jgi:hypothetical protein